MTAKLGKNMLKAWHKFLQQNFNVFMPGAPNIHKQRKFEHIDIQKQFEEVEKQRKRQRLSLIEYKKKLKKKLIEQQLQFLKDSHQVGIITDKNLQQEMQQVKDQKEFEQYGNYEEYVKQILKQKNILPQMQTITVKGGEEFEKVNQLEKQLKQINQELDDVKKTKSELEQLDKKIEDLEPGYILLTGMEKKMVMNQILYYEFQSRNLQGCIIHPETMKAIETVHYHVDHNLPIRRELLFEVVPELFETEMEQLDKIEREKILAKRPRLDSNQSAVIRVVEKYEKEPKKLEYFEELKAQEFQMMDLVYRKAGEISAKFANFIFDRLDQGFHCIEAVLENVESKPKEKLTEEEQQLFNELQILRKMQKDYSDLIKLNRVRVAKKQKELYIPKFIEQNEKLKKAWVDKWEEIVANSFDFNDSIFVPQTVENSESKLEQVLKQQRQLDLQSLIKHTQLEYSKQAGGDEPIRKQDRINKNVDLIGKLNVLSNAMNQLPEETKQKRKAIMHSGTIGQIDAPAEQNITILELPKILFLNNQNPKKYTIPFWAKHFNIEPPKLRNIFNYVSYAIPDTTQGKETQRILRFIYDNPNQNEQQQNKEEKIDSKITSQDNTKQ